MGTHSSSGSGFVLFSIITLFYVITKYIYSSGGTTSTKGWMIFGIYIGIATIVMAATNTFTVGKNCKAVNKSITRSKVWQYTLLFFTLPMTIMSLMLTSFTGWLTPFSNTIGYAVSNFLIGEDVVKLLRKPELNTPLPEKVGASISWIYSNPTIFLNALKPDDLSGPNWDSFSSTIFNIPTDDDNVKNIQDSLFKFLILKDTVSEAIWFLLVGWLCSTISENMSNKYGCTGIKVKQ